MIPRTAADLTPEWIHNVLQSSGYEATVSDVLVEPIGTGQMASSLRVTPTYAGATDAPASVVVKIASHDPNSRQAGARGAYLKEVRFYQELADELPVATPRSFWSDINVDTNDFVIVLEDMAPATQGDQIKGCGPEQAALAAINIAGLHAPRWGDHALYNLDWLAVPQADRAASTAELKMILAMMTPGFIDRYRPRLTPTHIDQLEWFAESVDSWLVNNGGSFALTHCDHRLDNLLFSPQPDTARPVTVVDWQTVSVRNPGADLAYLLGTSLEPAVRREFEHEIVGRYHHELCELGVVNYHSDQCFDDYRSQTPHSLLLSVVGSMATIQTDRGDDMFMAMLHRSSQQMTDLGVR